MKILDREETFNYLKSKVYNNERIVVPRYGDGEYILMTSHRNVAKETSAVVGPLLKKAIRAKGQLVCCPKRLTGSGIWYDTCKYVMEQGGHDLYGAGKWIRWDLIRNNDILPGFFRGRVLLVAGYGDEAVEMFKDIQPGVVAYTMPKKKASSRYKKALDDVSKMCSEFDNILFSCGPIGKVILAGIINLTQANLIDIGSFLPALLSRRDKGMLKTWSMSGYKERSDLDKLVDNFLGKI